MLSDQLFVCDFLEGINISQVGLDLRKSLVDAELTFEEALEEALPLEAAKRIEEEGKEPRAAVLPPGGT